MVVFLLCTLILPAAARADDNYYLLTGEEADAMLNALEWSAWTSSNGKADGRYIYVLTGYPGR